MWFQKKGAEDIKKSDNYQIRNSNIFLKKLRSYHLTIVLLFHSSLMVDNAIHRAAENGNIE